MKDFKMKSIKNKPFFTTIILGESVKGMESFTGVVKNGANVTIYYVNGRIHREDGPAVESDCFKMWCLNGELHRADGPAVEHHHFYKEWWLNGGLHRTDGPAVENHFYKEWWLNDELYGQNNDFTIESWIDFIKLK